MWCDMTSVTCHHKKCRRDIAMLRWWSDKDTTHDTTHDMSPTFPAKRIGSDPTMHTFNKMIEELRPIVTKIKTDLFPKGEDYGFRQEQTSSKVSETVKVLVNWSLSVLDMPLWKWLSHSHSLFGSHCHLEQINRELTTFFKFCTIFSANSLLFVQHCDPMHLPVSSLWEE